jgi:hypothetical protein
MSCAPLLSVVESLVELLDEHGYAVKAAWLSERAAVMREPNSSQEDVSETIRELHGVVQGMGGLFDLNLEDGARRDRSTATDVLHKLADELYELTR